MATNDDRQPRVEIAQRAATPEEAAAIAAAIDRFLRDTAGPPRPPPAPAATWLRASINERARLAPGHGSPWGERELGGGY